MMAAHPPHTAPTMASGYGKTHTDKTKPLVPVTLTGIRAMVDNPPSVLKDKAQWVIPSTLMTREYAAQAERGEFWMLWADLDKDPQPIDVVQARLVALLGGAAQYEIYLSRSAKEADQRAHILIPLDNPLGGGDWVAAQVVLNAKLTAAGLVPDTSNQGTGGLCYLPNRGEHYASLSQRTCAFFDPMVQWAMEVEKNRLEAADEHARVLAEKEAARARRVARTDCGPSLIAAFNDDFTFADVLTPKDYDQKGDTFRHPESESGSYSASVKDGRIHSLSTADRLYTGGGAHDVFSAFAVLYHDGDQDAALKDAGDNWVQINGEPWNVVQARNKMDHTDAGNVSTLAHLTGGNLRYVTETKTWLWWCGKRWSPDPAAVRAQAAALDVGQHHLAKSVDELTRSQQPGIGEDERKALERASKASNTWGLRCRNKGAKDNMLQMAQSDARFVIPVTRLDQDPYLFGAANGVVDLRTGEIRPAGRDDLVTKISQVAYVPGAKAPRWLQFISEITSLPDPTGPRTGLPRPGLAVYIQSALGYAMTGLTHEHKLFMAVGGGSNGKNILLDTVVEVMGDYAVTIPAEVFMVTKHDADAERATPGTLKLAGARLAVSSESKEGHRMDTAIVKRLTGERVMQARPLYGSPVSFTITHKHVLMTNHAPAIDHMDEATSGRMHVIPFDMQWNRPGHTQRDDRLPDGDKTLGAALRQEHEGILAWLVAGAVDYLQGGLEPPPDVAHKTRSYLDSQDKFSDWFETLEICPVGEGSQAMVLHARYTDWCVSEGQPSSAAGSQVSFSKKLRGRGVQDQKTEKGRVYGLRSARILNADLF